MVLLQFKKTAPAFLCALIEKPNQIKMKKTILTKTIAMAMAMVSVIIAFTAKAQTFTNGNLAVFVAAASASNTTGSIVELNTTTAGQTAVNTYVIGGTGASAMRFSGSATSTGYLANSNDGTLLSFTGANNTNTSSNVNTLNPRAVGTLNNSYSFSIATTYTGNSGDQTRCATSVNNTTWFIGDQGGLHTNGSTSPSPAANLRGVKSFGGTVYVAQSSSTGTVIQVSTASAPSGGSITGLPGLTNNASMQDFYLISSGSNGTSFDILYVISATSNTAGTITKYSLVSGTWTSNGSYTTTFGGFGMAAKKQGSGAYLFVSSGQGALAANNVIRLTDANGYNAALSITTANNVTLYTAATGTIVKGIAFAPASACTSPAITSVSNDGPKCAGNTLSLSVTATGTAPLSYEWSGPNSFSSTTQNPSISNAATAASGTYTVTVTNGCGSSTSGTSATINALPSAIITPDGPTTFCTGGSVNLNAPTETSYLWSTGATTQSINVSASGNYTVQVTNSNNCTATSLATVVTVNALVTPSVSISANPGNTICSGTNVIFTAVPTHGGASPSYQWKLNGNDVGTNSDTYSDSSLADGDMITCVMNSNASCTSTSSATSNSITINVTSTVTPAVTISSGSGLTVCGGTDVTFTATPVNGGSTPSFQWKLNGNNAGTNSDTYSNNSLANQDVVTCIMTSSNSCASPSTATSNSLTITIVPSVTPSVTISADPGNTVCAGTSVTFTASPVNGGTPVYQWTKNGNNIGTNSNTFTDAALVNSDVIGCRMISDAVCRTADTVFSATITITVNPNPTPSVSGTLSFCTGGSTVLGAGTGYASYLWSNNETTQTITVTSGGTYSVTVSDGICSGTSEPVTVTEIAVPAQPGAFTTSSATVYKGQSGVIYTIPNMAGVTYTWSYSGSGAAINGSTNSITVDFSLSATSGTLSVAAVNSCGSGTARTIAITVTPPLPLMRITEYMYNGLGAGSAGEFVEFTNVGSTTIDMTGWSFDDNSRVPGSQSLTGFGIVQPGESVVLTDMNSGSFRSNWNLCNGVKIIGNNTNNLGREDEINLYDGSGTLVDRLTYGDQTFAPGSIRTSGTSGWVTAAGLGNNQISQWVLSVVGDAEASYSSTVAEKGSLGKSTRATVSFDPCFVANGAPTIVINTSATSNYLDGGATTSPISPFGLSGVIDDTKDPLLLYGVDFTVGDDATPVNSLTVTATSGNTTVVPVSGLALTGTGASWNLKITPAAVGYSIISVTVNDGLLSTVYVINFAASDPAPTIIPANTTWHTGMSDASTGSPIDSSYGIIADDELNVLNVYSRSASGLPVASYNYTSNLALPNPSSPEVDVEGHAPSPSTAGKIYWTGSMSNGKLPYDNKPNRDRLFATTVNGTGAATTFSFNGYYNLRSALLAWGDANGYNFTASATAGVNPKGIAGFSLEGMCFGPDGTTLYLALRAPLVPTSFRHNAVIAPILNFETWFNNGSPSGAPTFGIPIELDLDFRGIREITRLSNGTYVIIAGSPIEDGGVNNIYKWTGYASDAPIPVANGAGYLLNLEGVMQVSYTNGQPDLTKLQVVTDGGAQVLYQDNSEAKDLGDLNLRKFRSDVLDSIDLDICSGFAATITPSGSTNICPGNSVTLTAPAGSNRSYLWSNGATTQSVNASAFQTYTVTVTQTTSGCTATSAPVTLTNALPSDFNADHVTNNSDFLSLLGLFNQMCNGCPQDLNGDGNINNTDFLILLGQFNQTCQ